ncbi:LOG family protein [Piscinibacter terrae]|uniref:Cytokinin riboside 5'-monophosphate phosphoribohydrolase n=1 Tax=Piscinibacter terrae TaxID=2496871 RepID=A0A3N7HN79_9BURK|nr:TIGR00730 family Rossman fold protein [Albitalea terrae]RQP23637.1 TIGR00730 family Rossman fold protein [Albitalea terrae]
MKDPKLSLCVYCGSRDGTQPAFAAAAEEVGTLIGRSNWQLVYGGGCAGLMGRVADAAISSGARTVGVIPQSLMQRELGHQGLDELHVVETMHQRKQLMAQRSDAFLALPGGIGTFEELFEVWTWRQLGYHDKPVALLNVDGYYDKLVEFLDQTTTHGFVHASQRDLLLVDDDAPRLLARIAEAAKAATSPDDYRRI